MEKYAKHNNITVQILRLSNAAKKTAKYSTEKCDTIFPVKKRNECMSNIMIVQEIKVIKVGFNSNKKITFKRTMIWNIIEGISKTFSPFRKYRNVLLKEFARNINLEISKFNLDF